jgi:hypothetical protein
MRSVSCATCTGRIFSATSRPPLSATSGVIALTRLVEPFDFPALIQKIEHSPESALNSKRVGKPSGGEVLKG